MSTNVSTEFLSKLDALNKASVEVTVLHTGDSVNAKPLTLKQQKDAISAEADGLPGIMNFGVSLNNIILNNTGLNDLMIYDRLAILIKLRIDSLGDKIKSENGDVVSLQGVYDNINFAHKFTCEQCVEIEGIKLQLEIPTIKEENIILKKCAGALSNTSKDSETVGLIYLYELIKYVKTISIGEDTIAFNDIKISERIKIIEKLPLKFYTALSNFFKQISEFERGVMSINDSRIILNSGFFDAS